MVFDSDIVLDNYLIYHGTLRCNFNEYRAIAIIGGNCLVAVTHSYRLLLRSFKVFQTIPLYIGLI